MIHRLLLWVEREGACEGGGFPLCSPPLSHRARLVSSLLTRLCLLLGQRFPGGAGGRLLEAAEVFLVMLRAWCSYEERRPGFSLIGVAH